jgi:hypothetical protein
MASFWREKPIGPDQNNSLKESSRFGEPQCKLRSNVVHFFLFLIFFHCLFNYKNIIVQPYKKLLSKNSYVVKLIIKKDNHL